MPVSLADHLSSGRQVRPHRFFTTRLNCHMRPRPDHKRGGVTRSCQHAANLRERCILAEVHTSGATHDASATGAV